METGAAGTGSVVNVQEMENAFTGVGRAINLLNLTGNPEEKEEEEDSGLERRQVAVLVAVEAI